MSGGAQGEINTLNSCSVFFATDQHYPTGRTLLL